MKTCLCNSIICYTIFVIILLLCKSDMIYYTENNKNGDKVLKLKTFGFGHNKTVFEFPVICILASIFIYMFMNVCHRNNVDFE